METIERLSAGIVSQVQSNELLPAASEMEDDQADQRRVLLGVARSCFIEERALASNKPKTNVMEINYVSVPA
jgi:hypothetical protein